MARSFNAMLDRLETVFRSQREFVQDASHELRDPLTICRGHLELLDDDPEERQQTIALVLDELDRMGTDRRRPPAPRRGRAAGLPAAGVRSTSRPFAHELLARRARSRRGSWRIDHGRRGTILADRHRLTEAVMNLAHNAVQHTGPSDTIAIGDGADADEARIWVRDTGTGISVSDQARIFDRFTRGRGAHRRYRGGGLGLAIVKAIAEAHGGRVELESRLGEGSTFTIVAPASTGRKEEPVARILIAEDDPLIGSFLEKGLRASGYTTFLADDGEQAQRSA